MALDWLEGQPYSSRFGDVYFSRDSGLEESRHVFLQGNHLAERFASLPAGANFCIAETGFGTGLNFLSAWQLFEQVVPQGASLDFFSVEKFPLQDEVLRAALALWPELAAPAAELLMRWQRRVPGWNRWSFAGGRIRLTLALEDVVQALPQLPAGCVDAWFLDGFAPAKNPEMWSEAVLTNIARAARAGATLASYTSAGWVRRGLQQAGFAVERVPGFGHKREMVCGQFVAPVGAASAAKVFRQQAGSYEKSAPRSALVIGGGIAGCAAAHALAQRGVRVTLIERAPQLASAASGNPRGILHARFGAGDNPLHRFVLAAYGHALGLLDGVLPVDGENRAECGLLQLACKPVEQKRIARLAAQKWQEHLLQFVDAEQAGRLTGLPMQYGGLWFPAGGWVVPPVLCAQLASDTRITQCLGHEVEALEQSTAGWRASGVDAQGRAWSAEAEVVVVCCAHAAKKLAPFAHFPLIAVRGQITAVPETAASKALQAVVCGDGYCAPSGHGVHVIGATHAFEDEATELRAAEHAENLASLAEYAPTLYQAFNPSLSPCRGKARMGVESLDGSNSTPSLTLPLQGGGNEELPRLNGRAAIRCSAPGSMPLVGEVAPPTRYWQSQPLAGGGAMQSLPHQGTPAQRVATAPGLYCSLAHGTRGLLTAGITGEVLAAQICSSLPPLPEDILAALVPLPGVRQRG